MPIYEYYCAENHTVYQFYAKTLAQGRTTPRCPDHPKWKLKKLVSAFAVTKGGQSDESAAPTADASGPAEDARMEAAMGQLEQEFSRVDENDPRAMGRMMRKMAEATGQPMDGEMEAVVRKLEEGTDPEALEAQLGGGEDPAGDAPKAEKKEAKHRFKARQLPPRRDPKLYDYD